VVSSVRPRAAHGCFDPTICYLQTLGCELNRKTSKYERKGLFSSVDLSQVVRRAHNSVVTSGRKPRERDLIGGVLLVLSVFFIVAFGTVKLLVWSGWNPLESAGYAYGATSIAFIVGAFAIYGLFRWARK